MGKMEVYKKEKSSGNPGLFLVFTAFNLAGPTGLEPATSGLTGQCANQLHHDPKFIPFENVTTNKSGQYWVRTSDLLLVRQAL